jgi:hypothetical protein
MGRGELEPMGPDPLLEVAAAGGCAEGEAGAEAGFDAIGRHAYYGAKGKQVSLWGELVKHSVGLVGADFRHRRAQRRQSFIVSGLAQIGDPILH